MNKYISFFLFAVLFLFSGCSNESSSATVAHTIPVAVIAEAATEATDPPTEPPTDTTSPVLQTYPLNPGMEYYNYAIGLPDHIYNTHGSENGLAGTIYTFDGTVTELEYITAGEYSYPCATVSTDNGHVFIMNMYKSVCEVGGKVLYSDNEDYYVFPSVGETANFLTVYMGYSNVKELPTFILGASADIMDIGEFEDPVAAKLASVLKTS